MTSEPGAGGAPNGPSVHEAPGEARKVHGYCPMGCGQTLFLGSGDYVTCSWIGCPRPDAVSVILDVDEHEHLVELGATMFEVEHPLRERLDGLLFSCGLHQWLVSLTGPPGLPGLYRVRGENGSWLFGETVRRD